MNLSDPTFRASTTVTLPPKLPKTASVVPMLFQSTSVAPLNQLASVTVQFPVPPRLAPLDRPGSQKKVTAFASPMPSAAIAETARTRQKLEIDPASAFGPRLDPATILFSFILVSLRMNFLFIDIRSFCHRGAMHCNPIPGTGSLNRGCWKMIPIPSPKMGRKVLR